MKSSRRILEADFGGRGLLGCNVRRQVDWCGCQLAPLFCAAGVAAACSVYQLLDCNSLLGDNDRFVIVQSGTMLAE
jgi:hypothetical protein